MILGTNTKELRESFFSKQNNESTKFVDGNWVADDVYFALVKTNKKKTLISFDMSEYGEKYIKGFLNNRLPEEYTTKFLGVYSEDSIENLMKKHRANSYINISDSIIDHIENKGGAKLYFESNTTTKKEKVSEGKKNTVLRVVYLNNQYSTTADIDASTNVKKLEKDLAKEFIKKTGSDDFWIDDVFALSGDVKGIDWMSIVTNGSRLEQDKVDMITDPDFAIKAQFLKNLGYDITENELEEVYVYDAKGEDWIEGNFKSKYPEEWLLEQADNMGYPKMILDNPSYFGEGVARMFSDDEVNGAFSSDKMGNLFVYKYR